MGLLPDFYRADFDTEKSLAAASWLAAANGTPLDQAKKKVKSSRRGTNLLQRMHMMTYWRELTR